MTIWEKDGRPEIVESLAAKVKSADGGILVSPEHNSGISSILKNAFDWISRVPGGVCRDNIVAIIEAAEVHTGEDTGQYMLRYCITPFGLR